MKPKLCKALLFKTVLPGILLVSVAFSAVDEDPSTDKARDYFTDLRLLTHEGKEVRFYSDILRDRVVLISGFYVNCKTFSPMQNLVLSRLQNLLGDRLGQEVSMVSITLDPKRDTLESISEYAGVFAQRPGWVFLTGKPENVDWVNYKLGQYTEDLERHKGIFLLGNIKTGLWMKASPQANEQDLLSRIEELLKDNASAQK